MQRGVDWLSNRVQPVGHHSGGPGVTAVAFQRTEPTVVWGRSSSDSTQTTAVRRSAHRDKCGVDDRLRPAKSPSLEFPARCRSWRPRFRDAGPGWPGSHQSRRNCQPRCRPVNPRPRKIGRGTTKTSKNQLPSHRAESLGLKQLFLTASRSES